MEIQYPTEIQFGDNCASSICCVSCIKTDVGVTHNAVVDVKRVKTSRIGDLCFFVTKDAQRLELLKMCDSLVGCYIAIL